MDPNSSSLEVHPVQEQPGVSGVTVPLPTSEIYDRRVALWRRRQLIWTTLSITLTVLFIIVMGVIFTQAQKQRNQEKNRVSSVTSIPLENIQTSSLGQIGQLDVNGLIRVTGGLVLQPSSTPTNSQAGQLYFDNTQKKVLYYDGANYQALSSEANTVGSIGGQTGTIKLGNGLLLADGVLSATSGTALGVASIQGQVGAVTLTGGTGITINGTTIANSGVISIAGRSGQFTIGRGIDATNGVISSDVSLVSGSASLIVTEDGDGHYTITDSGSGSGGTVALAPIAAQVDNSNNVSISINKTGAGDLVHLAVSGTDRFVIDQTGNVAVGTISYSQVTGRPASVVEALTNGVGTATGTITIGSGLTLAGNTLSSSGSGITAVNGTTNQVNASTVAGVVTLSLPQNIHSGATPTFTGVNTNAITPSAALTLGVTSQSVTIQGTTVSFSNNGATYNFGSASSGTYTICTTEGNCVGAGGGVTTPGGAANTIAKFTGAQAIGNSIITDNGTLVSIGGNLTVTGSLTLGTALAVGQGGTGATTLTANGVLLGNGTGAITATVAPTGGQVLLGNGSNVPQFTTISGDLLLSSAGVAAIQGDSVALGTDTTGNYVATLGALTGLTTSGNSGEGSTPTLSVTYGSGANTAVQGNTTLTCPSGTGNLTGGGTSITLGTGGACGNLNTVNNPSFSTSVTTPLLQNSGALSITPGGALDIGATGQTALLQGSTTTITSNGGGDIVLTTADQIRLTGFNCTTFTNGGVLTTDASGNITCANDDGAAGGTITGSGTANRITYFTGTQTVADSWLLQNGSTLELDNTRNLSLLGGNLDVTGTGTFSSTLTANGNFAIQTGDTFTMNGDAFTDLTGTGLTISSGSLQTTLGTSVDLTTEVSGILPVDNGGTGLDGSGAANGELLIGNGSGYTLATLTQGAGITITNGSGSISVASAFGASVDLGTETTGNYQAGTSAGSGISVTGTPGAGWTAAVGLGPLTANWDQTGGFDIVLNNASSELRVLESVGGAFYGTIDVGNLSADRTYTFPDATGTVCLDTGNCAGAGGGITGSGTTDVVAKFTGSGTIGDSSISDDGSTVTLLGSVNLVVQGGTSTFGTTTQSGSLTISDGSSNTVSIITGAFSGNRNYTLPDVGGNASFCLSTGNCAGAGGGVTGSGTNNRIAKFTSTGSTIGDSSISDDGTTITLNADLSVAANENVTLTSGTGTITQNYSNTSGVATTVSATNSATSGTTTLQGIAVNLVGTNNASGSNTLSAIRLGNVAAATNNSFYGLDFGTGYTDLFRYNGTQLISGTGVIQNAAFSNAVTYSNLTKVGALDAGSITSSFGSIDTGADNITTTGTVQGTTSVLTQSLDRTSGGALNIGASVATSIVLGQNTSLTGTSTFTSGTGTVLLQGNTDIAATVSLATKAGTTYTTAGSANNVALNVASLYVLDTSGAAQTITGIAAGRDGQLLTLVNGDAALGVTLSNNSGSSSAANRITTGTGSDVVIPVGGSTSLVYDSTASLWRVLGGVAGGNGTCSGCANTALSNLSGVNINTALNATSANLNLTTTTSGNIVLNSVGTIELQDNTNIAGNLLIDGTAADALTVQSSANGSGVVVLNIQQSDGDSVLRVTDQGTLAIGNAVNQAGTLAIGNGATGFFGEVKSTNLSGNRAYELPDSSGTFCLDSNNCANLITLQAAYINASSAATVPEIKLTTTASHNGIDIQDADSTIGNSNNFISLRASNVGALGNIVFGVGIDGNLYMRPSADRTDLVDINNNAGNNVFTVDSSTGSGRVGIGLGSTNLPGFTLDVGGTLNTSGAATLGSTLVVSGTTTVQGASLTIGTTSQQGSLIVHDGNGQTATISVGSALVADTALAIPTGVSASDTICLLTLANCAGAGGGVTGTGTNNRIAKFTSTGSTIGDSLLSESGTVVTVNGTSLQSPLFDSASGALAIGNSSATSVGICNSANCDSVTIATNTDADTVQIGDSNDAITITGTTIDIDSGTGASAIEIGNTATNHGIQIGTGAAVQTVVIGSTNTTSALTLQAGSNNITLNSSTVQFEEVTGTRTLTVETRSSNASGSSLTVSAGTGGSGASANAGGVLTLQGGAGAGTNGAGGNVVITPGTRNGTGAFGNVIVKAAASNDSTTFFQVQNASSASLLTVDTVGSNISLAGNNTAALTGWTTNANNFVSNEARYAHSTITANGYIYIIGGFDASDVASTRVQYAKLNANGSIGTWATTTALPDGRATHASVTYNGYVYVIGGVDDTTPTAVEQSTVYYAKLNSDGTIGAWKTGTALGNERYRMPAVTANGYVYVLGGRTSGGGELSTTTYAKINADGSLGSWTAGTSYPSSNNHNSHSAVAVNGFIYSIGGFVSAASSNEVLYIPLNSNGSMGSWSSTNSLTDVRYQGAVTVANGYIYHLGGENTDNTVIQYAQLNANGTVGTWATTGNMNTGRRQLTAASANGYIYALGGEVSTSFATQEYASPTRIRVGGALDLVDLSGEDLASGSGVGSASSLTAGDTNVIGNLSVAGNAQFKNGAVVNDMLTVQGTAAFQSFTNSTSAFQIQNSQGLTVLNVDTTGNTQNLITNSNFENDMTGWTGHSGTAAPTQTSSQHYDGNFAASATTTASADRGIQYNYSLAASTTYVFSAYVKASGSNFTTLELGRSNDSGAADASAIPVDCPTNQTAVTGYWLRFTCKFTMGGSVSGTRYLFIKQTDATARTFYVDAAQLEIASSVTPYRNAKVTLNSSSLIVNGDPSLASTSNAALQVNALSGGGGIKIFGSGESNLLTTALDVRTADDLSSIFHVTETGRLVEINGGNNGLDLAALQIISNDGGNALRLLGAASMTKPVALIKGGASPGSGADLVQLQNSASSVVARFNEAGNLFVASSVDAQSGVALNIGNTNATSISLCNSATCDTLSLGTNTDADILNFGDSNDTINLQGNIDVANNVSFATKAGTTFTTAGTSNNAALNGASLYLMDTSGAAQVINGITAGRDGQQLTLVNVDASNAVTLSNNSGSATGSRIITGTGANISLPVGSSIELIYDSANTVWRVVGSAAGSTSGVTGTGTNNRLAKFTTTGSVIGDSSLLDSGTSVTLNSGVDLLLQGSGAYISNPQGQTNSEAFGLNAVNSGANSLSLGASATTANDDSIAIGNAAAVSAGTGGIAIGKGSGTGSTDGIAVGRISAAGFQSVAIGADSDAAISEGIAIGNGSTAGSNQAIAVGATATTNHAGSISLGYGATTTATNQLVVGSSSNTISSIFFGNGVTSATPAAFTLQGTGGNGTNIAGADVNIASGRGTGSAAGGTINLQVSSAGGSGSSLNSLSTVASFSSTAITLSRNTSVSGSNTFSSGTGTVTLQGNTNVENTVSFATKAGTTYTTAGSANNVAISTASMYRLDTSGAAQVITGIVAGRDGQFLTLVNADASAAVTLSNNSGSSTAANRIITGTGADVTILAGGSISLIYDSTSSFWRVVAATAGSGVSGSGTNNRLAKFTTTGSVIGDSSLLDSGTSVTLNSNVDLILQGATAYISNSLGQTNSEAFGLNALVGSGDALAVGNTAAANSGGATALGANAGAQGIASVAIGASSYGQYAGSIAIGAGATTTAVNQLVIGGDAFSGTPSHISEVYIGSGVTDATPSSFTLQGTGGNGTNIAGADVNIGGGRGTGSAAGGTINLQASSAGGSGTTLNSLSTVASFSSTAVTLSRNTTISGSNTFTSGTGTITLQGSTNIENTVSFATKAGTTYTTAGSANNVAISTASFYRLDTSGTAQTITGIVAGRDGQYLTLTNADASLSVTLSNNSGSSTAANRIITGTGADITILPGASMSLVYDATSSFWRVIGGTPGSTTPTLQSAYNASNVTDEIVLNSTNGALAIRQDAGAAVTTLFSVTNNAGTTQYLQVDTNGLLIVGNVNALANTIIGATHRSQTQTAASTNSVVTTFSSGGVSGATSNSGNVILQSGNSTTSGDTGDVNITSGNATSGSSGDVNIDVGTATGTKGNIVIGSNADGVYFGSGGSGDLSTFYLEMQTGVNANFIIQSGSSVDATHTQFGMSREPSNTSMLYYGWDGTTYWNYFKVSRPTTTLELIPSGGTVSVGTADSTGSLFVLDTKNTSADPSGLNGGMYYNSALHQYRCFRGVSSTEADGGWEPCGINPIDRGFMVEDDFLGGIGDETGGQIGQLGWGMETVGTPTVRYNVAASGLAPTADHPGMIEISTGTSSGNGTTLTLDPSSSGAMVIAAGNVVKSTVGLDTTLSNAILRVGLHNERNSNAQPTAGVWWEAANSTNTRWRYCYYNGSTQTCATTDDGGVTNTPTIAATTWYRLEIRVTATGSGTSSATFIINGTSFTVSGVTIATGTKVSPAIACWNSTNANRDCEVDYFQFRGQASAAR